MAYDDPAGQAMAMGIDLNEEAAASLRTLPPEHVAEFLQGVARKVQAGTIGNPSNYICAAIKRGYTPNDAYQAQKSMGKGCKGSFGAKGYGYKDGGGGGGGGSSASLTDAMMKVQMAGIQLTEEASNALMNAQSHHAVEILQYVAERAHELRDPSNYISATLNRGYQSRNEKGYDKGKGKFAGGKDAYAAEGYGGGFGKGYDACGKGGGYGGGFGKGYDASGYDGGFGGCVVAPPAFGAGGGAGGGGPPRRPRLIPADLLEIEMKIVDINCEGLWADQQFDIATLLALRCLPFAQAAELLDGFANKARNMKGKGKGIANINNFVQAAVAKIHRGDAAGGAVAGYDAALEQACAASGDFDGSAGFDAGGESAAKKGRWD